MERKFELWEKYRGVIRRDEDFKKVARKDLIETPIVLAFLADDNIQEIQVCSTNLGMVYTLQKRYTR